MVESKAHKRVKRREAGKSGRVEVPIQIFLFLHLLEQGLQEHQPILNNFRI